jgi:hypothetical protein
MEVKGAGAFGSLFYPHSAAKVWIIWLLWIDTTRPVEAPPRTVVEAPPTVIAHGTEAGWRIRDARGDIADVLRTDDARNGFLLRRAC